MSVRNGAQELYNWIAKVTVCKELGTITRKDKIKISYNNMCSDIS